MRCNTRRTWKSRDIQALSPLSWCRICGRELYRGMKQDGYCPLCRPAPYRKGASGP